MLSVSLMLAMRLNAAGMATKSLVWLLVEIWVSFALAAVVLVGVSRLLGTGAASGGAPQELEDIALHWNLLGGGAKLLCVVGVAVALAFFLKALMAVRHAMRDHPLE